MKSSFDHLTGYRRSNGTFGIRNRVLVMAAADNVNRLAQAISEAVPGSTFVPATFGRGQLGEDLEVTLRTQSNLAGHPNVSDTLIVSFESASAERIAERVERLGRRARCLSLLDTRGHHATLAEGVGIVTEMLRAAVRERRRSMPISSLAVGLECGGSDATSGLVSNPAVGLVTDELIEAGAAAVFSEPIELVGCEPILDNRADPDVAASIRGVISRYEGIANEAGVDLVGINPTADNIAGGLTTIEEKSMGALAKTGTVRIEGVVDYGERVTRTGLWLMAAPAAAVENIVALSAGGCQTILFSSGSVNPSGSAISPTLKICANPISCKAMKEHVDVDLSDVLEGGASMEDAKERIIESLIRVLSGGDTNADILGYTETRISRLGLSV
ncbi:Altronate hydrolase OS=Castellaniella defragrans OX=75697 GN=HNR28_001214 PE=3 SV=1 [Castellaniella defragrans]